MRTTAVPACIVLLLAFQGQLPVLGENRGRVEETIPSRLTKQEESPGYEGRRASWIDSFTLVIGSFRTRSRALNLLGQVLNYDLDAGIHRYISSDGTTYWRVGVGVFQTREGAREYASRLPQPFQADYFVAEVDSPIEETAYLAEFSIGEDWDAEVYSPVDGRERPSSKLITKAIPETLHNPLGKEEEDEQAERQVYPRNPGTATALSILIAGGGHLYAGETLKGTLLLVGGTGSLGVGAIMTGHSIRTTDLLSDEKIDFTPFLKGAAVYALAWIYGIIDASAAASRHNEEHRLSRQGMQLRPVVQSNCTPCTESRMEYGAKLSFRF